MTQFMLKKKRKNTGQEVLMRVPNARDMARIPLTRAPLLYITLPPAASILANSSGLSGYIHLQKNALKIKN
jgi:hypothetical protein